MTTLSAGVIIAILVSLLKPFLEVRVPPGAAIHDGLIRAIAVVIGVAGAVANTAIVGHGFAWLPAWNAAGAGLLDSITAVAAYHLTSSSPTILSSLLPSTAPPAAATMQHYDLPLMQPIDTTPLRAMTAGTPLPAPEAAAPVPPPQAQP